MTAAATARAAGDCAGPIAVLVPTSRSAIIGPRRLSGTATNRGEADVVLVRVAPAVLGRPRCMPPRPSDAVAGRVEKPLMAAASGAAPMSGGLRCFPVAGFDGGSACDTESVPEMAAVLPMEETGTRPPFCDAAA